MKRTVGILVLLSGLCLGASTVVWGADENWAEDWFDQQISSGPGTFDAQQRDFYWAGSFTARRRMTDDFLVTATAPRVEVGCGGIDLFGGALSFLDAEYLVAKLQRVLQAAPAMAFQIALQEYCKPCVAGLEALETITNQINQLQMNDCQMARGLATSLVHPNQVDSKVRGMLAQGRSLSGGLRKNTQDFADDVDDGNPPDSTEALLEDCPEVFKDVFGGGSVLANITEKVGMSDYTDEMRGLVGDAKVSYDDDINQYRVVLYSYCLENDEMDPSEFIDGRMYKMDADGDCALSQWKSISDRISESLQAIATKLVPSNATALKADEIAFINAAPFPVLNVLRDGVATQTTLPRIHVMARPLASIYAYRIFDDLLRAIRYAAAKSNEVYENASTARDDTSTDDYDQEKCKPAIVAKALRHFQKLEPLLRDYRGRAQGQYTARLNEVNAAISFAQSQLQARQRHLTKIRKE